ncbi:MAG TPA: septation protein SpoVG family protein [bacterium]|nr:septation protein SpoVG family protein [bacterium]
MKITEIRIFPKEGEDKKLRAFATITLDDCFVVRDLKIIEGNKGFFVAMPSRRIKNSCSKCGHGNVVHSLFCNHCGNRLVSGSPQPLSPETDETKLRQSEHRDIAHPITLEFRGYIQKTVLDAYQSRAIHRQ